ncbi:hypothetical protein GCM10011273_08840 [Asticcacaulis endophyticus]|uniref:Uncharacterized protein n=1 Tax=Asticcacaulis endophyticus TaxID=1395890 RepID=A0A918PZD4_9CAUL|nr:hypothetical protein GCM10011273_08840 [Asticcacaulis endophyticus]
MQPFREDGLFCIPYFIQIYTKITKENNIQSKPTHPLTRNRYSLDSADLSVYGFMTALTTAG